jgi:predicted AAA+ superfamily ATPase
MKNVVYLHLRRNNYNVFIGKLGNKEIDFMAELNGERIYYQVTYMLFDQKTIDREFGNLLSIDDHYPKSQIRNPKSLQQPLCFQITYYFRHGGFPRLLNDI